MNKLTSQQRKLLYLVGIVLLLIPIIVLGMPAGQPVARSLLQHLFAIAGAHRCGAIRVDLSEPMAWLAREWSDPRGELFRFPVICFLPGSTTPAPPGAAWQTQSTDASANSA